MSQLPAILDIRDDLNRALAASDDENLGEEFETVRDRLDAIADRDRADREGVVDEIDNQLLRVEERLDRDEASRAIQSARNRLHVYRESREQTDPNLAVVDSGVRQHEETEGGQPLPVGTVTLTVTVANTGDDTEVVPVVTFYDHDADELESVRGPEFSLGGGEEEQFEIEVDVPADATAYAVSVSDTGDVRDRRRG